MLSFKIYPSPHVLCREIKSDMDRIVYSKKFKEAALLLLGACFNPHS